MMELSSSPLRVATEVIEPMITEAVEKIDRCPQCQSMLKFSAPEVPHQICRNCGYVIGGEATVRSVEEITDSAAERSVRSPEPTEARTDANDGTPSLRA